MDESRQELNSKTSDKKDTEVIEEDESNWRFWLKEVVIKFSSQLSKMKEKCCKVSYYCLSMNTYEILSMNTYEILKSDKIPLVQISFHIIFELYKLEVTTLMLFELYKLEDTIPTPIKHLHPFSLLKGSFYE